MVDESDGVTHGELWRNFADLRDVVRGLVDRGASREDLEQSARSTEADILRVEQDLRSERDNRKEDVRRLHEKQGTSEKDAGLARDALEQRVNDRISAVDDKVDALKQSQYDRLTGRVTHLLVALVAAGAAGLVSIVVDRIG